MVLKKFRLSVLLAGSLLALAIVLAGCAAQNSNSLTEEQQANRDYMAAVSQTMDSLDSGLQGFADAVSRNDKVGMRTQAENAYKALDKLEGLNAPSALSTVHGYYTDGAAKLRQALDEYINLYADLDNAAGEAADWSAYDKKIAEIQELYDEGIDLLKKGDAAAAEA